MDFEDLRNHYAFRVEELQDEKEAVGEFWEPVDEIELELTKEFLAALG